MLCLIKNVKGEVLLNQVSDQRTRTECIIMGKDSNGKSDFENFLIQLPQDPILQVLWTVMFYVLLVLLIKSVFSMLMHVKKLATIQSVPELMRKVNVYFHSLIL